MPEILALACRVASSSSNPWYDDLSIDFVGYDYCAVIFYCRGEYLGVGRSSALEAIVRSRRDPGLVSFFDGPVPFADGIFLIASPPLEGQHYLSGAGHVDRARVSDMT